MTGADTAGVEVRLRDLPVELHARAEERQAELLREFSHIANADDEAHIPARLIALVDQSRGLCSPLAGAPREHVLAARAAGREVVDVDLRLSAEALERIAAFADGLEEADVCCRSGDLLTLAAPPELVGYRRWLFGECARQAAGEPPRPWSTLATPGDRRRATPA